MSFNVMLSITVTLMFGLVIGLIVFKKRPRKLNNDKFMGEWRELQLYCRDKDTWQQALMAADILLDKALRRRRYRGKTMGERMVAAQRKITDNDDMWFAHNMVKKLVETDGKLPLKESDVKEALISYREALKDLGALPRADQKDS